MTFTPKIILATDFTEAADHSLEYTVRLFSGLDDTKPYYSLLHAFKPMVPYSNVPSTPVLSNDALQTEFKEKLESRRESMNVSEKVDAYFIRGNVQEAIQTLKANINPDLIVMGSRKKNAFSRMTIGAHTTNVSNESTCPVLAIPLEAEYNLISKIVILVLDDMILNEKSMSILRKISADNRSKISVLYTSDEKDFDHTKTKSHSFLADVGHDHLVLNTNAGYDDVAQKVEDVDPDMVVLIADNSNFLEKIFHNSIPEKLIYSSQVPTLILK